MAPWIIKAIAATASVVPVFIAIPFFRKNYGVDALVFMSWYFGAAAVSVAIYLAASGRGGELVPRAPVTIAIVIIGLTLGALANGQLFQAVIAAPNPGLPPVVYATASVFVFLLSALFAAALPQFFAPVSAGPMHLVGIVLVLAGLFLLAGGLYQRS